MLRQPPTRPARPSVSIARAVGVTGAAALLSLVVIPSVPFQRLFLTLVFQNSVFSTDYFLSLQGVVFFAFVLPIAYWVALVRLRAVGMGRALAETMAISLLLGIAMKELSQLIHNVVITWGIPDTTPFAFLRFIWGEPVAFAQTSLPAILAAGLGGGAGRRLRALGRGAAGNARARWGACPRRRAWEHPVDRRDVERDLEWLHPGLRALSRLT